MIEITCLGCDDTGRGLVRGLDALDAMLASKGRWSKWPRDLVLGCCCGVRLDETDFFSAVRSVTTLRPRAWSWAHHAAATPRDDSWSVGNVAVPQIDAAASDPDFTAYLAYLRRVDLDHLESEVDDALENLDRLGTDHRARWARLVGVLYASRSRYVPEKLDRSEVLRTLDEHPAAIRALKAELDEDDLAKLIEMLGDGVRAVLQPRKPGHDPSGSHDASGVVALARIANAARSVER